MVIRRMRGWEDSEGKEGSRLEEMKRRKKTNRESVLTSE